MISMSDDLLMRWPMMILAATAAGCLALAGGWSLAAMFNTGAVAGRPHSVAADMAALPTAVSVATTPRTAVASPQENVMPPRKRKPVAKPVEEAAVVAAISAPAPRTAARTSKPTATAQAATAAVPTPSVDNSPIDPDQTKTKPIPDHPAPVVHGLNPMGVDRGHPPVNTTTT